MERSDVPIRRESSHSDSNYSHFVSKKIKSSARTGQACDRCKVRKIRCDSTAGGCSPCRQAQAVCQTTDRNTGRATKRGHTDRLEDDNRYLRAKLQEYHQHLKSLGASVGDSPLGSSFQSHAAKGESPSSPIQQGWDHPQRDGSPPSYRASPAAPHSMVFPVISRPDAPSFHPGLSMLRGTKLSLFGMEIDAREFGDGFEDTESPKSYEGLITILSGQGLNIPSAQLPENLSEAKVYADWYFKTLNPYSPVIHKPDMYKLLSDIYDRSAPFAANTQAYEALSVVNKVSLHMMLAHIKYQFGQRNEMPSSIEDSVAHYKLSLVYFPDLLKGQTIQDIQALCLIAIHSRNFQKPEAAWFITQVTLSLAVEIGMHRSASSLSEVERKRLSNHHIEMRKRIFWTIYGLGVGLSGRLGRPMPLRIEDIDIEFPEALPDYLPEEVHLTGVRKCSFSVGIAVHKLLALFGQIYCSIYTVRGHPEYYDVNVIKLEEELRAWRASIPHELSDPNIAVEETKIFALYLQVWDLECQFILRHPVVYRLHNQQYDVQNLKSSLDISSRYLALVNQLCDQKCLDCPWINVTVFLAVIFTSLFVQDMRKQEITPMELQTLRAEMQDWTKILGEAGRMLGTGPKLQSSTRHIMDHALDGLSRSLTTRDAAAVAAEALTRSAAPQSQQSITTTGSYMSSNYDSTSSTDIKSINGKLTAGRSYIGREGGGRVEPRAPYANTAAAPYVYPDPSASSNLGYQAPVPAYNGSGFNAVDRTQISISPVSSALPVQTTPTYGQAPASSYYGLMVPNQPNAVPNEWMRWTQANLNVFPATTQMPQIGNEYLSSANTLMTLSGRGGTGVPDDGQPVPAEDQGRQWPMNLFTLGQGPGGNGTGGVG